MWGVGSVNVWGESVLKHGGIWELWDLGDVQDMEVWGDVGMSDIGI